MVSVLFSHCSVVVRGGGDLASGVIYRLHRAGFPVIVAELPRPTFVRRAVSFGEAVYHAMVTVEGLVARHASNPTDLRQIMETGAIPVLVDLEGKCIAEIQPSVVVDARMAKTNLDTSISDALLVVGLGPGFTAGVDCHVVVETNRGHDLGRVIYAGTAEPDTGEPGIMEGKTHSRVLRSPAFGHVRPSFVIGDRVEEGETIATIDGQAIIAAFTGVLRGLIHEQVWVEPGMKVGDLDPRARREACFSISDKSLAVGGGVLEAVLAAPQLRPLLLSGGYEATASL
jgi:xanthine dehydrogenase accessory factor